MNARMANINDIDVLIKIRFEYFTAENWEVNNEKRETISSRLHLYYSKHINLDFFAAFVEDDFGNIVSTSFLAISEKPANIFSFPTGKTGTILNVFTYPKYRRVGYATMTLNLLIEEAKRQNLSYLELSASDSGKPLYKKLGFQELIHSHFTEMKMSLL
jgi:GNAT superfamily N-acetyltransferase